MVRVLWFPVSFPICDNLRPATRPCGKESWRHRLRECSISGWVLSERALVAMSRP